MADLAVSQRHMVPANRLSLHQPSQRQPLELQRLLVLRCMARGHPWETPIEIGAASAVLEAGSRPLQLSAAKSILGHAEPAAGDGGNCSCNFNPHGPAHEHAASHSVAQSTHPEPVGDRSKGMQNEDASTARRQDLRGSCQSNGRQRLCLPRHQCSRGLAAPQPG